VEKGPRYRRLKTKPIRDWLAKRPRWHVHFTPISASRINQVDRFFALLTDRQIRRGVHQSTTQRASDIRAFIDAHNANPKPFRWTKSADDILAAIQRFCQRTHQIGRTTESEHQSNIRSDGITQSDVTLARPYHLALASPRRASRRAVGYSV
jgi:hypothetical protein